MARLDKHRHVVRQVLTRHAQIQPAYGEIEREVIFDGDRDRYQVVHTGWEKRRRVYGCLIHVDIKGDKICIQYEVNNCNIRSECCHTNVRRAN